MKYFIFFIILNICSCLEAKKSAFDINKPGLGLYGAILLAFSSGDKSPPTIAVTNLKSKGTIETGSLIGTANDNVEVVSVEVQVNSGSYTAATMTGSGTEKTWSYKIPTTAKWTYSLTNNVNIRAKDSSGNEAVSALTSIRKVENHDINGDGYADLVVGAPNYTSAGVVMGRVYVFNGSANGITQTSSATADQTFTGTVGNKFGSSIAMTDLNGDGFADMIVCEFAGGAGTHSSYYYLGSSAGFGSKVTINQEAGTEYCTALVVGDFNNDGYGDVVISAVTGQGNLYVYNGNANGLNLTPSQTIAGSAGSNIGVGLAKGDINGDGKSDLVAKTSITPYIVSYLSNGSSLVISTTFTTVVNTIPVLGDFNGDGKADLAVGNSQFNAGLGTSQGRVYIFTSNGSSLNSTSSQTIDGEAAGSLFAENLSIGDINQDGVTDLIAGNPSFNTNQGKIYGFYGCVNLGICKGSGNASSVANIQIAGATGAAKFGNKTKVIDINRDGFSDLLVSPLVETDGIVGPGAVHIFDGSADGFTATSVSGASKTITGTASSTEQFGASLY